MGSYRVQIVACNINQPGARPPQPEDIREVVLTGIRY